MAVINNKIDFAAIVSVSKANPNGDPLNGNRPRTDYEGRGEISDVCIKRKMRNRLIDDGYPIFVQSDDYKVDKYDSLRSRADGELKGLDLSNKEAYRQAACAKWLDVRAFGQLFAFKKKSAKKAKKGAEDIPDEEGQDESDSVSVGIRGPVSIHPAFSIDPVSTSSIQITKSVNGESTEGMSSDRMGMKHRVDFGLYTFYGSINPQLATRTGFSDEDAEALKKVLQHLFRNDASSARPEGSMEVVKLYWWSHNNPNGQYSTAKVHRSLHVNLKSGILEPHDISDYDISCDALEGLNLEIYDGE